MTQAPDGKLVATGDNGSGNVAVVARVTETGFPDGDFHGTSPGGVRFVDVPGSGSEEGLAIDVLSDRSVLIGGRASNGAFLAELQENGEPRAEFGSAGIAVHDLGDGAGPSGEITDLVVLPDGKILAVGAAEAIEGRQAVVARFTASGDLDPSFASDGIFKAHPTPGNDEAYALQVLPDGRILVAGLRGGVDTWLFRLTADGGRDTSFGANGETLASVSSGFDLALGLALQPDGRAVVAGEAEVDGASRLMAARFTADPPRKGPVPTGFLRCAGKRATIVGTNRNDVIAGTQHADVIVALKGNDKVRSRNGNDLVCGGPGSEVIKAGRGRDKALGQAGRDIVTGGIGRDLLLGGAGGDRLYGGAGRDRLFAGGGNDRLVGSKGRRDLCNGGSGRRDHARGGCELLKKVP
jgi:uncharacterized delta-60 repeat protein